MGHIIILAIVQGLAELLPVSSSAHVIVAEKLMGLDPSAPDMTLLLVMLHTGTMLAVIVYFWRRWRSAFFHSMPELKNFVAALAVATVLTAVVGGGIVEFVEKVLMRHEEHAWVEQLFNRLDLIAIALAVAGVFILAAGLVENRRRQPPSPRKLQPAEYSSIGAIQGLCVPFRGFSRSGATISTGLFLGVSRRTAEDFSFALAVVLTPPADAREIWRLYQSQHHHLAGVLPAAGPSLLGVLFAFLAGLLALKWLSRWLETGRWHFFGIYCLVAAAVVGYLHHSGL
ncbi:MAG TPA: undecaprenyl-diphosphate phosphatase [Steroidobacteraceae bacterium]|jgi:undecaprenyl-diphosphatase|nr:undecaprenyl-diphosphate phosphatase [Steroidobacteraceae bacterium]